MMADALSTRLAEIRARMAKATPPTGFCDQHAFLAARCPLCAADVFPDAVFLLDTLEAALRVVEASRTFEDDAKYRLGRADMQKFLDAITAFTQHTEPT